MKPFQQLDYFLGNKCSSHSTRYSRSFLIPIAANKSSVATNKKLYEKNVNRFVFGLLYLDSCHVYFMLESDAVGAKRRAKARASFNCDCMCILVPVSNYCKPIEWALWSDFACKVIKVCYWTKVHKLWTNSIWILLLSLDVNSVAVHGDIDLQLWPKGNNV